MRKEQITGTNNSVCNYADITMMEEKGMKQKLMNFNEGVINMLEGLTLIIVAGTAHLIMDYMESKGMVKEED